MDDRVKGWILPLGGIACLKEDMFCKKVFDGMWGMEKALTSGKIHGCQELQISDAEGCKILALCEYLN
ncbi:hypothetical protein LIER_13082 [Lithospermum erythrorhizon]|uniref:Uncharacterized protein n=1 Tax=Lithospermum erythrorhizon TaxID=34254 RepID=A0AAV3PYN3_LITER